MRKKYSSALCVLIAAASFFGICPMSYAEEQMPEVAFYVAPDGNDNNTGTIDQPLATIEGARDKVREYKKKNGYPEKGIAVYFREGEYHLTERIQFTKEDSGVLGAPIIYRGYQDETPKFTGGAYIKGSEFEHVTDEEVLKRFQTEDARENVLQYNLKEHGFTEEDWGEIPANCGQSKDIDRSEPNARKMSTMEVFVDDVAYDLARYPNKQADSDEGWLYVGDVIHEGASWDWELGLSPKFYYSDTHIESWASYDDVHVAGYLAWDFYNDDVKLKSIDKKNKTLTLQSTTVAGAQKGKRFFFYNVLDELDTPGEYYIDRTNGILYLYPTKDLSNTTVDLSVYHDQFMYNLKDVSFMKFQNISFELTRGSVFNIVGGDSVQISCCYIKNIGMQGIYIGASYAGEGDVDRALDLEGSMAKEWDNLANGINHSVTSTEVFNSGYGGIYMRGGDYYHLVDANFRVENCKIHDFARRFKGYVNGINYNGRGYTIRNNEIYNAPNGAMIGKATGVLCEYNHIYNVVREIEDAAAIYTNYCWPAQDMIFRYNYIHDIPSTTYAAGHVYWDGNIPARVGIYSDTDLFSPHLYGNVFANIPMGYYASGTAEDLQNNIFVDVDLCVSPQLQVKSRVGWTGEEITSQMNNSQFKYYFWHPYKSQLWRDDDPEFYNEVYDKWIAREDSAAYMGTSIRNVMVYYNRPDRYAANLPEERLRFAGGEDYTYEDTIVTTEDPGFVDLKNGNYQLREDAPLFDLLPDFEMIDMSKIGRRTEKVGCELREEVVTVERTVMPENEVEETEK